MKMKSKSIVWIVILLLLVSNVYAPDEEESPYQEQIENNEDFIIESGGFLSASDLQSYSGTAYLVPGSAAEMPHMR